MTDTKLTGKPPATPDILTHKSRPEKSFLAEKTVKISQTNQLLALIDAMEALKAAGAVKNATLADEVTAELRDFARMKLKAIRAQEEKSDLL